MYETSDSNGENNEDDSWESNIMLKDNRWSMSKGEKNKSDDNCLLTTPIIIRHNYSNKNKNLLPNTKPLPPPLNLTDDEFNTQLTNFTGYQTSPLQSLPNHVQIKYLKL